jgi:hypothetical protein
MSTAESIRKRIERMRRGEIFTTRDMVHHGKRGAVDTTLCRLNKNEVITRVAFGVYIKGNPKSPMPSVEKIARTKSNGFRRLISSIDVSLAKKLKFPVEPARCGRLFATSGRSSMLWTIHGFIYFVGASLRKISLAESTIGTELRTIWHLGNRQHLHHAIKHVVDTWTDQCWNEAESRMKELPQWLSEHMLKLPRAGANRFRLA